MKPKIIFGLLLAFAFTAPSRAESPCTECFKSAQTVLATCLSNAKTDAAKTACNRTLQAAVASCNAGVCANNVNFSATSADAKKIEALESCNTVGCNCSIVNTCVAVSCTKYDEKGLCVNQICVAWKSKFVCK